MVPRHNIGDHSGGDYMDRRVHRLEIDEAVPDVFITDVLMLLLHVPAAITACAASLHLNQAGFAALKEVHEDVHFADPTGRLSSQKALREKAGENEVLTSGTYKTGVNLLHNAPLRHSPYPSDPIAGDSNTVAAS